MIVRTTSKYPVVVAIALLNWQVVNRNYPAGGKFRLTSTYTKSLKCCYNTNPRALIEFNSIALRLLLQDFGELVLVEGR
jgi:hypothetical protein